MAFPNLHINNPILKRELDAAFQTLLTMKGNMYFVHSGTGSAYSAGTEITHPMATLDDAVNKCTANQGDIIILLPGHAETITTASAIDIDVAGIKVYGIGEGEDRPKITISTANDASIEFASNSTVFKNIILICAKDGLTGPMLLKGVGLDIDVETRDSTNLIEAVTWFLSEATCNHLKLKTKHVGFTDGSGNTSYINLVGADYPRIDIDYYGKSNTSVIEFSGTKAINALVKGFIYNQGDVTYSKFIVDTITGSTWAFWGKCGENGTSVQGSQDTAIAGLDTSAVAAALAVIDAFHDVPVADVADNTVMSDVIGNKSDTVAGTSIVALSKQIIANIAAVTGYKKTVIADGTTIPNNSQGAAGLLGTATSGDIMIEEIIWQRAATDFVGPTNYEITTDNVAGLTGAAAPQVVATLNKFNANKTGIASIDGSTKQLPFVLESGKKLYIHGDDAATSAGGSTNFYIRYKSLAAGATLA